MSCSHEEQSQLQSQNPSFKSRLCERLSRHDGCWSREKCSSPTCFEQKSRELEKLRDSYVALKLETDKEISFLKQQLASMTSLPTPPQPHSSSFVPTIAPFSLHSQLSLPTTSPSAHKLVPTIYSITDSGVKACGRIARLGSAASAQVLDALQPLAATGGACIAQRILAALADPMMTTRPYLRSLEFAADIMELSAQVGTVLEREARCLELRSPVYVFGDVHGNWRDLRFFAKHLWPLGLELTAGSFLFLGDYVDRGSSSLECMAYLLAHKLLEPDKLFLLRGNHETRAVNGLETHYGSKCLLAQCKARFGVEEGRVVWHELNNAFDRLPVAAVIDKDIFCVHGGIPRSIDGTEPLLATIAALPTTASLDTLDTSYYVDKPQLLMIADMIWGDPVRNEEILKRKECRSGWRLDSQGFGKSPRGGVAVRFGSRAIDTFFGHYGFSRILRAHEATRDGVAISNSARVITVFSTSQDHGLGDDANCGCILVDQKHLRVLNRGTSQESYRGDVSRKSRPDCVSFVSRSHYQQAKQEGDDETDDEGDQTSSIVHRPVSCDSSSLIDEDNNQNDDV